MTKPEADRDELIEILAEICLQENAQITSVSLNDLPVEDATTLRKALNQGIHPERLMIRLISFKYDATPVHYVVTAYRDQQTDFTAYYIVQGSWLIASYEN